MNISQKKKVNATISIDSNALLFNLKKIKDLAPKTKILAMVKSNAYGHGLLEIAGVLSKHVDAFGVIHIEEAMELRLNRIDDPVVLMRGFYDEREHLICVQNKITVVIHSFYQIELLKTNHAPITVWVKFDSGLNRLGFEMSKIKDILSILSQLPHVTVLGCMTHLAHSSNSDFNDQQMLSFAQITKELQVQTNVAKSIALLNHKGTDFDWIRPGGLLYGLCSDRSSDPIKYGFKQVISFSSRIMAIRTVKAGESIGYDSLFIAKDDMLIGIVDIGYADGYPRSTESTLPVLVNDVLTYTLGQVAMNTVMIDLTKIPSASIGTNVVLWNSKLPLVEISKIVGRSTYDLSTNLSSDLNRLIISEIESPSEVKEQFATT